MSESIKRLKVLNAENQRVIRVSAGVLRAAITEINAHVALNGPGIMTAMVLNGLKGAIGEPSAVGGEAGKPTSLREGIAAIRGSGVEIDQQKIMAERGVGSLAAHEQEPVAYDQNQRDLMNSIVAKAMKNNLERGDKLVMADVFAATMALMQSGFRTHPAPCGTNQVDELVMLVKRLAHSLKKANPDSKLHLDAMDYLKRNALIGLTDVLRVAHPAPSIPTVSFYRDGIEAAAKWVDAQREAYDNEHGRTDPDTGSFEFGNDAQLEYSATLAEIAEGIRALHPNAASAPSIPAAQITPNSAHPGSTGATDLLPPAPLPTNYWPGDTGKTTCSQESVSRLSTFTSIGIAPGVEYDAGKCTAGSSIPAAVPEEATPAIIDMMARKFEWGAAECIAAFRSWNACRAAMLQVNHRDLSYPVDPQVAEYEKIMQSASNGGWIPVSERLPGSRESVLLWDADLDDACSGHYSHETGNFYQAGMIIDNDITHWQPLPAAPEVKP